MQSGNKLKGQLADLPGTAILMVVLAIVVGMGVLILVGMNGSTEDADAAAVLESGIDAMGQYGDWFETIVIVIIAVAILGLVLGAFMLKTARGRGGRA